MEELEKKLTQLKELIKAIRETKSPAAPASSMPSIPKLPGHKPLSVPSMTPSKGISPKIGTGQGPDSKKDPRKVAQQIKDGSMSTKTPMLKFEKNGQWSMADEPTTPSSI